MLLEVFLVATSLVESFVGKSFCGAKTFADEIEPWAFTLAHISSSSDD